MLTQITVYQGIHELNPSSDHSTFCTIVDIQLSTHGTPWDRVSALERRHCMALVWALLAVDVEIVLGNPN